MAQTPVTVMPCSLQSIAVVTDIIAKERYFQPEKKQKKGKEMCEKCYVIEQGC